MSATWWQVLLFEFIFPFKHFRPNLGGCQDWAKRAERALTDAKKDNDFIYHERIPEVKGLTSIGRAAVVKPTAVPDTFIPGEKELFAALMPVHIHQAVAAYEVRKQELVGKEVGRLKEGTNMMNEILTSMNLPAGLEDTTGGGVPASLVEKCQAVVAAGGVFLKEYYHLFTLFMCSLGLYIRVHQNMKKFFGIPFQLDICCNVVSIWKKTENEEKK